MRALAFLLGARAIDMATQHGRRPDDGEPDLPPFATTPEQARAWRRWAAAGRMERTGDPSTAPVAGTASAALRPEPA
jgi:hypothetical protein